MDFLRLNRRCCGISPPVLAFPTNSCPVITRRSVTQVPAPPPMSRGAILWGGEKFIAARLATQMFSCWLEEALLRGIIRPPRARFDFYQARSAWSRAEWIGAGRMAIDGLKEVQESVMRIEAGLSTYEELALMGEDYQDIFRQQVRESAERQKAGLSRPVWIAQAYQQQIAESRRPEEETTPRET